MSSKPNLFFEGQKVVCISEDFPLIKKYSTIDIGEAKETPKKNEIIIIDEILGEFLRFNKYDTPESFNWWKYDRFAPLDDNKSIHVTEEMLEHNG